MFLCNEKLSSQEFEFDGIGERIRITAADSSFYLKFGFRFQTLYSGSLNLDDNVYNDAMLLRRTRIKFDGWAVDPRLVYKLELAISNRDQRSGHNTQSGNTANIVLDAALKWNFSKGWQLWWGQTKLPGNRERVISSQNLQFVDRSLVNSRFNLDRDIGIQLHHKGSSDKFRQKLAISMGQGRNVITSNPGNGYQVTGRLEFLPMGSFTNKGDYFGSDLEREPRPKISFGLTGDINFNAVRQRGNLGSFLDQDANQSYIGESDMTSIIADMIFKHDGFSIQSEFVKRSVDNNELGSFGTGSGFVFQAGYLFPSNWELASRFTDIDADATNTVFADQREFTLGVSKYISGHDMKIQSDISYQTFPGQTRELLVFRVQTEIAL